MYNYQLHHYLNEKLALKKIDFAKNDTDFYSRFLVNLPVIKILYQEIYGKHKSHDIYFEQLINTIASGYKNRSEDLRKKDKIKLEKGKWFLSNELAGMSLYVDRFCGNIKNLETKLDYFEMLGVNLLHLMPLFESPEGESDGGYAVSDFRTIDKRFGTLKDLQHLQKKMQSKDMHLMIDIVLNHTSHHHQWARAAKEGDPAFQDYYYMYADRTIPNEFDSTMPEVFPESSPGSFSYVPECNKWAMTVFHKYQWDLNYSNPAVLIDMIDTIFFYANLGVDILRIDAPAFIWKQLGTTCQNLPKAHTLLRLIKQCTEVAAPGMALLGEAIVAPAAIMDYFGTGTFITQECDFAYNATNMALQWDALATGDTRVMLAAQTVLSRKPAGASWITYTRCHDDIGLGFDDYMIEQAGFNAFQHRQFLKNYYSANYEGSPANGALFSSNPKTGDARISGSLASLCGLELAINSKDEEAISTSIKKIVLMQAMSFFEGGLPMLYYGDEAAYTNDYSYLSDPGKSYDNRWMHRPIIDWKKNELIDNPGTIEEQIFSATQKLLQLRKKLPAIADYSNIQWIGSHNIHVAGFVRQIEDQQIFCVFNFSQLPAFLTWYAFKENGKTPVTLFDHFSKTNFTVGKDHEFLQIEPYSFLILEEL